MGMFDQIKEAMKMRSEAKRIQNEIQKISVTHSNGGITVTAKGDMTISAMSFSPEAYDEVNAALKKARDTTQQEMAKMMQAGGVGGLFGK